MWELDMLKSNKKKGFSLIEQLCAISILSILSICVITIQLNNVRLKEYNKQVLLYCNVLEALKQEIIYNYSYADVRQIYYLNKRYITKDKLTINNLKSNDLSQIFSEGSDMENTYLLLNVVDGEVLKIQIELHLKLNYKEEIIDCEFNKGNYI
jgi:prepilin-type N-terminal cleavage/methylation domain-containing protein